MPPQPPSHTTSTALPTGLTRGPLSSPLTVLVTPDPRVKPAGSPVRVEGTPTKTNLSPPLPPPAYSPHSRTSTARSRRTVGAGNAGGVGVVLPRWATPSVSAEKPPPLVRSRRKYRRDGETLVSFHCDYRIETKVSPSPHFPLKCCALRPKPPPAAFPHVRSPAPDRSPNHTQLHPCVSLHCPMACPIFPIAGSNSCIRSQGGV